MLDFDSVRRLLPQSYPFVFIDRVLDLVPFESIECLKNVSGKVRISSSKRYTGSAGGEGGVTYELKCPKGHVVTGVRGGSGIYLDSIQLICSPLE